MVSSCGRYGAVLENANRAILSDIREHSRNPEGANYPADDSPLLPELSRYLVAAGTVGYHLALKLCCSPNTFNR
jgi:hypothetical protein